MRSWEGVLETLVTERRGALVRFAYLLTGDRHAAEDLVHDAIIRTFSRARRLDNVAAAEGYVRRAITTQFLNGRRAAATARAKRHLLVERETAPADDLAGESAAVARAMATLTPRQRACVVLRFFEDLSTDQTAERLDISPGGVKRHVHDAVARLREELGEFDVFAKETHVPVVAAKGGVPWRRT